MVQPSPDCAETIEAPAKAASPKIDSPAKSVAKRRMANSREAVFLLEAGANEENFVAPGEQSVSQGIVGLEGQRLFKQRQRLACLVGHRSVNVRRGPKYEVVGVEAIWPRTPDTLDLGITQTRLDRTHDIESNFILQVEDVFDASVIALGPDMMARSETLQSKAGYIDARPLPPLDEILLRRTAGPYIGSEAIIFGRSKLVRLTPNSDRKSGHSQ